MDTRKLVLFFIFAFSVLMLADAWTKAQQPPAAEVAGAPGSAATDGKGAAAPAVPVPGAPTIAAPSATAAVPAATGAAPATPSGALPGGERIRIETDLAKIELDTVGGDLRRFEMLKHKQTYAYDRNFVLLDETAQHTYVAQSGLIGPGLPTHLTK